MQRQHHEGSPTAGVHDHGHKLGVNGAEVAVPGHLGDPDVIVALVSFHGLAEDVPELTGPHNLPGHGELTESKRKKLQAGNKCEGKPEEQVDFKYMPSLMEFDFMWR